MLAAERTDERPAAAGTWMTRTMTERAGGALWIGVASSGTAGTEEGALLDELAPTKLAALIAVSAPVRTTPAATPPVVHEDTRRSAWSRSAGRYSAMSVAAATAVVVT